MQLMSQARQDPVIGLTYDMARIFEWVAQLAGLKNITQFKVAVQPDQNLINMARLGNIIPLGGGKRGGQANGQKQPAAPAPVGASTSPYPPRQMSGMGPVG
jgi:hypothetical protein